MTTRDIPRWQQADEDRGRKPAPVATGTSFLVPVTELSQAARALYQEDEEDLGYVMNASRLWAHLPEAHEALFGVAKLATKKAELSLRDRGILVTATVSTIGDSYCALMWGKKLAEEVDPEFSGAVLSGDDEPLNDRERALARWARRVAADPNSIRADDVQELRDAGFDDGQILGITSYVAVRIAFAIVNDALGAGPDSQLRETVPAPVRNAVRYGRPIDE